MSCAPSTFESPYAPIFPSATRSSSAPAVSAIGTSGSQACVEEEIDALDAEASEAALDLPLHARRRQAVVGAGIHRGERLRREDDAVRLPGAQPVADGALAAAAAVRVGGVEGRDPRVPRRVHERERLLGPLALPEELRRGPDAAEVAAAEDDP